MSLLVSFYCAKFEGVGYISVADGHPMAGYGVANWHAGPNEHMGCDELLPGQIVAMHKFRFLLIFAR